MENEETGNWTPEKKRARIDICAETDMNEVEIWDVPNKEFKIIVINMFTKVKRAKQKQI
jgi:hypothetical protein